MPLKIHTLIYQLFPDYRRVTHYTGNNDYCVSVCVSLCLHTSNFDTV